MDLANDKQLIAS